MRSSEYSCICGFHVWLDLGKFYTTNKDGSWSGEITHCPRCQADLQKQLKIQKDILHGQLLKIKLKKEI